MQTRPRVNLQSAEKALSHVGGLAVGMLIGLLLTPANILDAIVDTFSFWIKYEIASYQCYRRNVSLPGAFFAALKHNANNEKPIGVFEVAKLRCDESEDTNSTFKTTMIYLVTRPFVWIIFRPIEIALTLAIKSIAVLTKPFSHAYLGAKAGFVGSFVAVPKDWFAHSATVDVVKRMTKKSENSSSPTQTHTDDLEQGQQTPVDSQPVSERDAGSFIGGQLEPTEKSPSSSSSSPRRYRDLANSSRQRSDSQRSRGSEVRTEDLFGKDADSDASFTI